MGFTSHYNYNSFSKPIKDRSKPIQQVLIKQDETLPIPQSSRSDEKKTMLCAGHLVKVFAPINDVEEQLSNILLNSPEIKAFTF